MRSKIRRFHFLLFMFCTLWAALPMAAQNINVKGRVVDAKDNEPIIKDGVKTKSAEDLAFDRIKKMLKDSDEKKNK